MSSSPKSHACPRRLAPRINESMGIPRDRHVNEVRKVVNGMEESDTWKSSHPMRETLRRRASAPRREKKAAIGPTREVLDGLPRVRAIPQWTCLRNAIGDPGGTGPEINLRIGKLCCKHNPPSNSKHLGNLLQGDANQTGHRPKKTTLEVTQYGANRANPPRGSNTMHS